MGLYLWGRHRLIDLRSRDDAASPATARAAVIFGSCASDHFLNPLVRLFIEIPMMSSSEIKNAVYGDDFSNRTEQSCVCWEKNFFASFSSNRIHARAA